MKKREKIQWLSSWYFTAQTSYLRAQEFRNKVTQHKELRVPLNFIHLFTQSRQKNGISVLVRLPETAVLVKQAGKLCTALKRWDAIVPRLGSDKRGCFMGTFRGWVDFSRSCAGRWRKVRFLGDGWISAPFCSWARFAETDRHTHRSTCGKLNMCAAEFCQSENSTVSIFYSYWLCIILYSCLAMYNFESYHAHTSQNGVWSQKSLLIVAIGNLSLIWGGAQSWCWRGSLW